MSPDWQWIVVGGIVIACAVDVLRRVWGALRQFEKGEGGCRRCSSCTSSSSPSVVAIAAPKPPSTVDSVAPGDEIQR